jgi:two-component system, chemotaxis family, sensor kinase Cph1
MPEPTGLEGLRILIAEDNLFAAMELEQTLLAFGCQPVGPVARLDQALSLALSEDLDGALLDVELQGEMVFAVAEELQRRRIPVTFASGYGTDDVFPAVFAHYPRLPKPFGEDDVRRALAAMVAGRSGR